jgi:glycosyltransferase involved in cell wall biosynthesis
MNREVMLQKIGLGKIIWVGTFPSHYVRKMHLGIEKICPETMHFVYTANIDEMNERNYERGTLPVASAVINEDFPVWQLLGALQKSRPRAIIVAGYGDRLLAITLLWCFWKRIKFSFWSDTNLLITQNGNSIKRLVKKLILKVILTRAHKLLYVGTRNRDFYIWLLGLKLSLKKLYFLPYPAIISEIKETLLSKVERTEKKDGEPFKILYLGRLEPIKAVHNLIHALTLLPSEIRNSVHLDIFGGGSEEDRLKEMADRQNISKLVSFHGPVPSHSVAQAYLRADVFVLPSDKEPWGLVVNEALLAGVPVMCPFWVGAATDLITDGETGYVLENNNSSSIALGIERAFRMGSTHNERMGTQGRTRVITGGWNEEAAVAKLVALVDELSPQSDPCAL